MQENIKLICFDLDDTLTDGYSWMRLNMAMGMSEAEDNMLVKLNREGALEYEQWTDLLQNIYKKRGKATLAGMDAALSTFNYKSGVKETIAYLQNKGYQIALVSGAVDMYVDKIARDLGITLAQGNSVLVFDSGENLERIVTFGDDYFAKLRHLESFCRRLGIALSECACIGDGENDIEMFRATGRGITFTGSPIASDAWQVVDSISDLQKIF